MKSSSPSIKEGAAEWSATGLENRGASQGQGFDSSTLLHVRTGVMQPCLPRPGSREANKKNWGDRAPIRDHAR